MLRAALAMLGPALSGMQVTFAVVRNGVLYFVTDPMELGDPAWSGVLEATTRGQPAGLAVGAPVEAALPLIVAGSTAGVLLARRSSPPLTAAEAALLQLLSSRIAAVIENGRLLDSLTELLAEYMSADVAGALLAGTDEARLGGEQRDVSVLFADLHGFTAYSERNDSAAVVALLNRYFDLAVPAVVDNGGTVSTFIGDAIMGLFGAPRTQPEHPLLAARAALAMRDSVAAMVGDDPDLPRFRIGVNTGPATVGSIGSQRRKLFTAIGDTVNLASRLEGAADVGQVVIGEETYAVIRGFAEVTPLQPLLLKGKAEPVRAWVLHRLRVGSERVIGDQTITGLRREDLV